MKDDIPEILEYNKNDVFATNKFLNVTLGNTDHVLYKGKNKIELRQKIAKKFGLKGYNFNDVKLGTELILKLYCNKYRLPESEVRKARTPRRIIQLGDCLPKWMDFKTHDFDSLINEFNKTTIFNGNTKGVIKHELVYKGIKIVYGTGGAHASTKPGIYDSDDEYLILDLDIDGMYPQLGITQGLYPEHLGIEFIAIYGDEIVKVRLKEKKKPKEERDFVIIEGYKLGANGFYGKTNEESSWAYDPLYTMNTTISGQILISMWAERLILAAPECKIIQVNTDGITVRIKRNSYDACIQTTEQLMKETKMSYEEAVYKRMVIRDVSY